MHAQGEVSGTLPLLPVALLALAIAYVVLAARARRLGGAAQNAASEAELQVVRRIVGWPLRRTAVFLTGVGVTLWALLGPLAAAAHDGFTGHMAQHLLVGMLGPFLVVLGAPVTLLLRWGPPQWRRTVGRTLHLPVARWLAHPVVALVLSVGTLPLLYGTGVYAAAAHNPWLHTLMHAHFFASGYLFAWVIAGPDPAPARRRPRGGWSSWVSPWRCTPPCPSSCTRVCSPSGRSPRAWTRRICGAGQYSCTTAAT